MYSISKKLNLLNHVARIVLLIVSLLALYFFYLTNSGHKELNRWGENLIKVYHNYYKNQLDEAKVKYRKDQIEGITELLDLKDELSGIRNGDRLYPMKKDLYFMLSRHYINQNQSDEALKVLNELILYSPRDLRLKQKRISLLYNHSDKEKAVIEAGKLWNKFPEDNRISNQYCSMLTEQKNYTAAVHVLNKKLNYYKKFPHKIANVLSIYWSEKKGFSANKRKTVALNFLPNQIIEALFTLPKGTSAFRVDFAGEVILKKPSLYITSNKKTKIINIWEEDLKLNQMNKDGELVFTNGAEDPYIVVPITEYSKNNTLRVVFRSQITKQNVPFWIEKMIKTIEKASPKLLADKCKLCTNLL